MKKNLKTGLIFIGCLVLIYISYRMLFIRTVNYEVAGVKIPSYYNKLTGKITPIKNYKGKKELRSYFPKKMNIPGFSTEESMKAELRWAIFSEWVKKYPEYKEWDSNPEIFKKAHERFTKEVVPHTRAVVIK